MTEEHEVVEMSPEEWAEYQAQHEISEEERQKLTAQAVEVENQEAPTEEE